MRIAILTFDGFNELDSLIAFGILHRVRHRPWRVQIASPTPSVTSMNGLVLQAQCALEDAREADAVIIGSGVHTRQIARDTTMLARIELDPRRQLIGAQCSGTLILAQLGILGTRPACTDLSTKPWVIEAGVRVLDQPFFADGNVATAGGCLASHYLAAWVIARLAGEEQAREALHYVAPVGEKRAYVERAMLHVAGSLATDHPPQAAPATASTDAV